MVGLDQISTDRISEDISEILVSMVVEVPHSSRYFSTTVFQKY